METSLVWGNLSHQCEWCCSQDFFQNAVAHCKRHFLEPPTILLDREFFVVSSHVIWKNLMRHQNFSLCSHKGMRILSPIFMRMWQFSPYSSNWNYSIMWTKKYHVRIRFPMWISFWIENFLTVVMWECEFRACLMSSHFPGWTFQKLSTKKNCWGYLSPRKRSHQ